MFKVELEVVRFAPNDFLTASDDGHNNGYTDIGDLMRNIKDDVVNLF